MRLHHLTLNTGDMAIHTQPDADRRLIDRLLPVIDASGGAIPELDGWFVALTYPVEPPAARRNGAAFFQLAEEPGLSKRPAVMGFACWEQDHSDEAWQLALQAYRAQASSLEAVGLWREPPAQPPVPWTAVWLTIHVVDAPHDALPALGAVERCIAWTLVAH